MWVLVYRDDGEDDRPFFIFAIRLALVFGALNVFTGDVREVLTDPLKAALFAVGAVSIVWGEYADKFPESFHHFNSPGANLTSLGGYLVEQGGAASKGLGTLLVYAAASGIDHERRRAAQAFIVASLVLIVSNVLYDDVDGTHIALELLDNIIPIVALAVPLYVLHSKPVTAAHTTTHGTNPVLKNTLLVVGVLGLLFNALAFAPASVRNPVWNIVFPEAKGQFGAADLPHFGDVAALQAGLHVAALFAGLQGSAHEQRRVAQVLVLFAGLASYGAFVTPSNGDVNEVQIGIFVASALLLLVGLYAVPSSSEGKVARNGSKVGTETAETPAAGRGGRPRSNSTTPKRK